MATDPAFASTPGFSGTQISTANTNRDGSGSLGTVATIGANGGKVERIRIQAVGSVTNGMVRIFISTDGGTTKRLFDERAVTTTAASGTVEGWEDEQPYDDLVLPAGALIYASTHNAETFNVFCIYGDF